MFNIYAIGRKDIGLFVGHFVMPTLNCGGVNI